MKVAHDTPNVLRRAVFDFSPHKSQKKITGLQYYTFGLLKHSLTSTPSYFLKKFTS